MVLRGALRGGSRKTPASQDLSWGAGDKILISLAGGRGFEPRLTESEFLKSALKLLSFSTKEKKQACKINWLHAFSQLRRSDPQAFGRLTFAPNARRTRTLARCPDVATASGRRLKSIARHTKRRAAKRALSQTGLSGDRPELSFVLRLRPVHGVTSCRRCGRWCISYRETRTCFGGRRRWFECPGCGRACRVLFGGPFRCRRCHGLHYTSDTNRREVYGPGHYAEVRAGARGRVMGLGMRSKDWTNQHDRCSPCSA